MQPSWNDFADWLCSEFPQLRDAIEAEALDWNPQPHYFLENYLLPELVRACSDHDIGAASHATAALESILCGADRDVAEAAIHSVLIPLANSPRIGTVRRHLGTRAAELIGRLEVQT